MISKPSRLVTVQEMGNLVRFSISVRQTLTPRSLLLSLSVVAKRVRNAFHYMTDVVYFGKIAASSS